MRTTELSPAQVKCIKYMLKQGGHNVKCGQPGEGRSMNGNTLYALRKRGLVEKVEPERFTTGTYTRRLDGSSANIRFHKVERWSVTAEGRDAIRDVCDHDEMDVTTAGDVRRRWLCTWCGQAREGDLLAQAFIDEQPAQDLTLDGFAADLQNMVQRYDESTLPAVARDLVLLPDWEWLPGAVVVSEYGRHRLTDDEAHRMAKRERTHTQWPDLTDGATVGTLVELVKRKHGRACCARPIPREAVDFDRWAVDGPKPGLGGVHLLGSLRPTQAEQEATTMAVAPTEVEAWAVALACPKHVAF